MFVTDTPVPFELSIGITGTLVPMDHLQFTQHTVERSDQAAKMRDKEGVTSPEKLAAAHKIERETMAAHFLTLSFEMPGGGDVRTFEGAELRALLVERTVDGKSFRANLDTHNALWNVCVKGPQNVVDDATKKDSASH